MSARGCGFLLPVAFLHRKANALNVEPMQPMERCRLKPPTHWGPDDDGDKVRRWLGSGGEALVFGRCNYACPMEVRVDDLPAVLLAVFGDVFRASGTTLDDISWSICAEAERADAARCNVQVGGCTVADITVHAPSCSLTDEVQAVCAALVWSAIRAVRRDRA